MQICLDLRRRCVLSAAKRAYTQAVNQALRAVTVDAQLEARIQILKRALEDMDLAGLRGRYPELAGGRDAQACLCSKGDTGIALLLGGREVATLQDGRYEGKDEGIVTE